MKRLISIAFFIFLSQISSGQVMMMFSSDSLVNITSPLDLDSLFYWFAADVGVTDSLGGAIANNEGVGTWADLSGNGYNVTQTTDGARPVYKATGGPASKPAIQFDGSNDFLSSAAHWWESDDITVFAVAKWATATRAVDQTMIGRYASSNFQWALVGDNSNPTYGERMFFSANGSVSQYDEINSAHTTYLLTTIIANAALDQLTWYEDGTSQTIITNRTQTAIYDATQELVLGDNSTGGANIFQGSISEIIVYSRALTTAERTAIETYLNRKYDLY